MASESLNLPSSSRTSVARNMEGRGTGGWEFSFVEASVLVEQAQDPGLKQTKHSFNTWVHMDGSSRLGEFWC